MKLWEKEKITNENNDGWQAKKITIHKKKKKLRDFTVRRTKLLNLPFQGRMRAQPKSRNEHENRMRNICTAYTQGHVG